MADYELIIAVPLRLSEREVREAVYGVCPEGLRKECVQALIWLDEGVAAGVRTLRARAPRRRKTCPRCRQRITYTRGGSITPHRAKGVTCRG